MNHPQPYHRYCLAGFLLLIAHLTGAQSANQPVDWVNPLIGTTNGGSTFPGATLPYGLVRLGPDCTPGDHNAGYAKGKPLLGFSHTHVSGTGGAPKYGNVLVMPFVGQPAVRPRPSRFTDLRVAPGYFAARLTDDDIDAELTVTHRVGFHRYTFPAGSSAGLCIDAGHLLRNQVAFETQQLVGSEIEVISPTELRGHTRVRGGWNRGEAYTVYFHVVVNRPAESVKTWKEETLTDQQLDKLPLGEYDEGQPTGALLSFGPNANRTVLLKVGISFISSGKARASVLSETPNWDFDAVRTVARQTWNRELSRVEVNGGAAEHQMLFYSALYFTMLMPSDRTGENPLWSSDAPYYDDFYTLWDTFRATDPLRTLLTPSRSAAIARSLLDTYAHEGFLPDGRSGNSNGRTQGGSNADVFLTDLFVKGVKGVDYELAYRGMVHNAEIPPGGDEQKQGRGGILAYKQLGYVPFTEEPRREVFFPPRYFQYERAGSRTLEYAQCDYALSVLAEGLGKTGEARTYRERATNWKNLWRPLTLHGARGFIWPRRADGTWIDEFKPTKVGSWGNFFYESNSWEYSFFVPHDMRALIDSCGGRERFIARLDTFFDRKYYGITNEPSFLVPCLYNYVGLHDRTAERITHAIRHAYHATEGGLPGNDDAGSMTAWFVFHAMGFFPVAGQDVYLLSTPLFDQIILRLEGGQTFTIDAHNRSERAIYVRSARLNGKPLAQNWFRHPAVAGGGSLVLEMSPEPVGWDKNGPPPPSMSDPR